MRAVRLKSAEGAPRKPKHWFAPPPRARASSAVEEPSAHFVFDVAAIRPDAACDVTAGRQAL